MCLGRHGKAVPYRGLARFGAVEMASVSWVTGLVCAGGFGFASDDQTSFGMKADGSGVELFLGEMV